MHDIKVTISLLVAKEFLRVLNKADQNDNARSREAYEEHRL